MAMTCCLCFRQPFVAGFSKAQNTFLLFSAFSSVGTKSEKKNRSHTQQLFLSLIFFPQKFWKFFFKFVAKIFAGISELFGLDRDNLLSKNNKFQLMTISLKYEQHFSPSDSFAFSSASTRGTQHWECLCRDLEIYRHLDLVFRR